MGSQLGDFAKRVEMVSCHPFAKAKGSSISQSASLLQAPRRTKSQPCGSGFREEVGRRLVWGRVEVAWTDGGWLGVFLTGISMFTALAA